MNSLEHGAAGPCWPDEAIEELASSCFRPGEPAPLDDHVGTCPTCSARFAAALREAQVLREILLSAKETTEEECPATETLALYLDAALNPTDREAVETHLCRCRHCQGRLVTLYRDLLEVRSQDAPLDLAETIEDFSTLPRPVPECEKITTDTAPAAVPEEAPQSEPEDVVLEEAVPEERRKRRYLSR